MAKVSVREMMTRFGGMQECSDAEKLRWLSQAEGFVRKEALGDEADADMLDEAYLLTAEMPYDEMYRYYVEAQAAYALQEMGRYNNAAAAWNSALLTYRDYCARKGGRAKHLRVC